MKITYYKKNDCVELILKYLLQMRWMLINITKNDLKRKFEHKFSNSHYYY